MHKKVVKRFHVGRKLQEGDGGDRINMPIGHNLVQPNK